MAVFDNNQSDYFIKQITAAGLYYKEDLCKQKIAKDIIKQRMGGDDDYVMIVDEEGGEEVDTSRFGGSSPTYNSTMSNLLDSLYDL